MHDRFPWTDADVLVLGCGNVLYGDDGFGPAVAQHLQSAYHVPHNAVVIDAGLGVREILFDLVLSKRLPRTIVIIDSVDGGREPGEIFEMSLDDLPDNKRDDFSMHQVPTSNLLTELRDFKKVEVCIIGAQPADIPPEVRPGLSRSLTEKTAQAAQLIFEKYLKKE